MDALLPILQFLLLLGVAGLLVWILQLLRRAGRGGDDRLVAALERLAVVKDQIGRVETALREEQASGRAEAQKAGHQLRTELAESLRRQGEILTQGLRVVSEQQKTQLDAFSRQLAAGQQSADQRLQGLAQSVDQRLQAVGQGLDLRMEKVRESVDHRLGQLQAETGQRLQEMQKVVDEKLQSALERRLGESFKLVCDRLDQVHQGLGEMQALARGVGDLQRVLTNVKTRGTWGEVQLRSLLEQLLTREQYRENVATRPGSAERVEFAVRLPGRFDPDRPVWLPIDAKFPQEDYLRLLEASERADPEGVEAAALALENRIRASAKEIRDKYLHPPETTDFALLYLPTEGLYAEALRRPGLAERVQREYRVVLAGPTTLSALLNSLQMGFRTLAIEKRSSEVWQILGAIKTEFGRFGEVLDKVQKKLVEASHTIDEAGRRRRVMERHLRGVEAIPAAQAGLLLPEEDAGAAPDA